MSSSVSACIIPAIGVRPPFFTFVAVRAIAPVAGMPPKSGDTMFATPCATSSMFERCRPPIMPSATTAESSDSIAPSSAMVNAGPTSAVHRARARGAASRVRQPRGDARRSGADRLDGRCSSAPRRVVDDERDERPGNARLTRGHRQMIASANSATPQRRRLIVADVLREAPPLRRRIPPARAPMRSPKKSLTSPER